VDHEGFFNGTFTRALIFIVNTNLVASKDYPKSIPALLEPKYKGKLVMDNESYDFLAALLEYYGEAEGKKSLKPSEDRNRVSAEELPWWGNWLLPVSFPSWSTDRIISPTNSRKKARPSTIFFRNPSCR
jgi:hypothetical protein